MNHLVTQSCSFLQSHRRAPEDQKQFYITENLDPFISCELKTTCENTTLKTKLCCGEWAATNKHVSHTLQVGVSVHTRAHAYVVYLYGGTVLQTRVGLGMCATAVWGVTVCGTWEGTLQWSRREIKPHTHIQVAEKTHRWGNELGDWIKEQFKLMERSIEHVEG